MILTIPPTAHPSATRGLALQQTTRRRWAGCGGRGKERGTRREASSAPRLSLCLQTTRPFHAPQATAPCFTDAATTPDLTSPSLVIPAGLLAPTATSYRIDLTAAKGARTDTDSAAVCVLAGAAPTGSVRRVCPGAAGCTSKPHTPTEPLRLVFTLDDSATLLSMASFNWTSEDLSLPAMAVSTTKQVGCPGTRYLGPAPGLPFR